MLLLWLQQLAATFFFSPMPFSLSESEEHFQEGSYDLLRKNCRDAHHRDADADDDTGGRKFGTKTKIVEYRVTVKRRRFLMAPNYTTDTWPGFNAAVFVTETVLSKVNNISRRFKNGILRVPVI